MEKRSYSIFDPPVSVRAGPFVTDGSLAAFFTHLLKITHIFFYHYINIVPSNVSAILCETDTTEGFVWHSRTEHTHTHTHAELSLFSSKIVSLGAEQEHNCPRLQLLHHPDAALTCYVEHYISRGHEFKTFYHQREHNSSNLIYFFLNVLCCQR